MLLFHDFLDNLGHFQNNDTIEKFPLKEKMVSLLPFLTLGIHTLWKSDPLLHSYTKLPHYHMMTSSNINIFWVTGPSQKPVMWNFGFFFDPQLYTQLSKQLWGWWFEMPSQSLWYQCNAEWKLFVTLITLFMMNVLMDIKSTVLTQHPMIIKQFMWHLCSMQKVSGDLEFCWFFRNGSDSADR